MAAKSAVHVGVGDSFAPTKTAFGSSSIKSTRRSAPPLRSSIGGVGREQQRRTSETSKKQQKTAVQQPDEWWELKRKEMQELLEWRWFDAVIGVVIVFNAITIGVEQSLELREEDTSWVKVIESLFLTIYIAELAMRVFAYQRSCLHTAWVKFDCFLVIVGVLTSWILEPAMKDSPSGLGPLLVLRTARLLRLAKTARLFARVEECWMLVRGFMNSASIMLYTFVIVFITLYVFSCLGVELVSKHRLNATDPDFEAHVQKYFSSLPQTLLTLIRFCSLDNTAEVYKPLVDKDPWLGIYFLSMVLILSIVFYHLLGAVIFCSTLDRNIDEQDRDKRDQEEQWANLIQDLKDMFVRLDVDNSGHLSREEVLNLEADDQVKLCEMLEVRTPLQVFNALDIDKSGAVSINEFFDGMWDMALQKGDVELKRMEKQVETMHWRLKETFSGQHELSLRVDRILGEVARLSFESSQRAVPHFKVEDRPPTRQPVAERKDSGSRLLSNESSEDLQQLLSRTEVPAVELIERLQHIWEESLQSALDATMQRSTVPRGKKPAGRSLSREGSGESSPGGRQVPRRVTMPASSIAAADLPTTAAPQFADSARRPSREPPRTPSKTLVPAPPAAASRPQRL